MLFWNNALTAEPILLIPHQICSRTNKIVIIKRICSIQYAGRQASWCILPVWGKSGNWEQLRKQFIVLISPIRSRVEFQNMGYETGRFLQISLYFKMK